MLIINDKVQLIQGSRCVPSISTDLNGTDLAKGVYYYRALLTTPQKTYTQTGRLMVLDGIEIRIWMNDDGVILW